MAQPGSPRRPGALLASPGATWALASHPGCPGPQWCPGGRWGFSRPLAPSFSQEKQLTELEEGLVPAAMPASNPAQRAWRRSRSRSGSKTRTRSRRGGLEMGGPVATQPWLVSLPPAPRASTLTLLAEAGCRLTAFVPPCDLGPQCDLRSNVSFVLEGSSVILVRLSVFARGREG